VNHKKRDLLIVLILYIFSFGLGVFVFEIFDTLTPVIRLLLADIAAMLFIYILSLILNNASLYDPYWSVIPPVFLTLALFSLNKGLNTTYFLFLFSIYFWAIRLTLNWIKGWHGFNEVDWRYLMIRDKAPKLYFLTNFLAIQLFPTLIVFAQLLVGLKIIELCANLNIVFVFGFLMVICATVIQYISDEQMRAFRKAHEGTKKCIDQGLWRISRHPNYFGEVTVWWGLYVMYLSIVQRLDFYILAPLSMTLLFVFISIPMMEKKILKTRPEYKEYQEQVSMLIPFLRKNDKSSVYQENN
jgi:steroid 5-alpha reductase family enzyme